MALQSASLKEFENFSNDLKKSVEFVENTLNDYEVNVRSIIDDTLGGTQALSEAALVGIKASVVDLVSKTNVLLKEISKISGLKEDLIISSKQQASKIIY